MFIFYFCLKQQDKHCIRHYDCDYDCDYDKKIRYNAPPLVETFFFYFLKQTCSDTIWGLQIFMLCMDSPVIHHLSPNNHNQQWDCISHKTFPFFAFHHHSFLSIFSKKSSLNMSKSLSINNKFSTKLNVYCKS